MKPSIIACEETIVHTAWFQSTDPLTHLPRALDVVRRMGFELCAISSDTGGGGLITTLDG